MARCLITGRSVVTSRRHRARRRVRACSTPVADSSTTICALCSTDRASSSVCTARSRSSCVIARHACARTIHLPWDPVAMKSDVDSGATTASAHASKYVCTVAADSVMSSGHTNMSSRDARWPVDSSCRLHSASIPLTHALSTWEAAWSACQSVVDTGAWVATTLRMAARERA